MVELRLDPAMTRAQRSELSMEVMVSVLKNTV